LYSNNNNNI